MLGIKKIIQSLISGDTPIDYKPLKSMLTNFIKNNLKNLPDDINLHITKVFEIA